MSIIRIVNQCNINQWIPIIRNWKDQQSQIRPPNEKREVLWNLTKRVSDQCISHSLHRKPRRPPVNSFRSPEGRHKRNWAVITRPYWIRNLRSDGTCERSLSSSRILAIRAIHASRRVAAHNYTFDCIPVLKALMAHSWRNDTYIRAYTRSDGLRSGLRFELQQGSNIELY